MTDVDAWIDGAKRTHRSVTIYQRADLIADIDDLDRQIQIAQFEKRDAPALEVEWRAVAKQFSESELTLTVRGLTDHEDKAIRAQAKLEKSDSAVIGARLIAAALVEPVFTPDQVIRLRDRIGDAQINRVVAAMALASQAPPPVPVRGHLAADPLSADPSTETHPSSASDQDSAGQESNQPTA